MMNISALRHNAESNDPVSSESEEGEEITLWPEHVHENSTTYAPYAGENQWATFEWSNRDGKSVARPLPRDQQYPVNLFGHSAERAFADFPEPDNDLSSGEDDNFTANLPDSRAHRPRSPSSTYAVSNERHTPIDPQLLPSFQNSTYRLGFSDSFQSQPYDYAYGSASSSHADPTPFLEANGPALPRISIGSYADDSETGRRRVKQLFDDTEAVQQFLNNPITSPLSDSSLGDVSAKAKGKQRHVEDAEEFLIPNIQMSGLRLGVDMQAKGTRTSPRLESKDGDRRTGRSRSSTTGSVYYEEEEGDDDDEDDEEYTGKRLRKTASRLLNTGSRSRRSRAATSRSGKRTVTSEGEEDSPLERSVEGLPSLLPSPSTKTSGKKRRTNRYPCPVPSCKETFTRRNDVRRHIRNAAVHRDSPEALALLGEAVGTGTRCKFCNADLSRSDARMRHERASACGKRTTQKMKDQMLMRT
ncbi:hypothetical protein EV360DRAFT_67059 [Lentinula raphanica]|nr:hypothetical protein EV360DRAFT_67059 [Lentinula raphanica]